VTCSIGVSLKLSDDLSNILKTLKANIFLKNERFKVYSTYYIVPCDTVLLHRLNPVLLVVVEIEISAC
jgi:hypothetical protein